MIPTRMRLSRRLALLTLTVGFLAGCSNEFAVSPSLDPRASRVLLFQSSSFLDGRPCLVYLPPGYPARRTRYPVLYVHDGESAFDADGHDGESFGFDRAADALLAAGQIEPLIIVAITSGGSRLRDYVPVHRGIDPGESPGDVYVRAIRDQLKPRIDRTFATHPDPLRTGIAGFSLGGLISVYAGYAYPEAFGIMGGFSGTYFWFESDFYHWLERQSRPPGASLFVDVALGNDNVASARWLDRTARAGGFVPGVDYSYAEIPNGAHSITSVRERVPAFLRFFSRRAASMPGLPATAHSRASRPAVGDHPWPSRAQRELAVRQD